MIQDIGVTDQQLSQGRSRPVTEHIPSADQDRSTTDKDITQTSPVILQVSQVWHIVTPTLTIYRLDVVCRDLRDLKG